MPAPQKEPRGAPIAMIGSGILSGLLAAALQAAGARYLGLSEQGHLAVGLTLGTFAGQIFAAYAFEAKLASAVPSDRIRYPRVLLACTVLAAVAIVVAPRHPVAYLLGAPVLLGATMASRMFSVIRNQVRREALASVILATGGLLSLLLVTDSSMRLLAVTGAAAVVVRYASTRSDSARTDPGTGAWVVAETFTTGLALPVVSAVVLVLLGPATAVAFRVLLTTSAVLEPALAYLRTRLLVHERGTDVRLVLALMLAASAGLMVAGAVDAFALIFGPAWDHVTLAALALAAAWKLSLVPTQVPFASLRRKGRVIAVFFLRAASLLAYVVLAVPAALTGHLALVFLAFVVAELVVLVPYLLVDRRTASLV